jgi:hypothetical protein
VATTKLYTVEFDGTVPTATGAYTEELAARKTFNIFRAWNANLNPQKYGLYWTHDIYDELPGKFSLETPGWNYHYVGKSWNDYPGIEQFVRKGVNWGHDAEYGTTLATDYTNPEFHDYFAELVAILNSDVDGILLDWWHDNHYEINSKSAVARARQQIAQHVREKMGDDFLLVGNVNWDKDTATIENLNGVFLELYKTPYERKNAYTSIEIDSMIDVLKYYENELQYPKLIAFEPWRVSQQSKSNAKSLTEDRLTAENQRFAKLFATILNVHTSNGYYLYADNNHDTVDGDHGHAWYSFYDLDIGKPTSKGVEVSNRVGIRKYEKGLLGYNYTSTDIEIDTPNGTIKIPSQSGAIQYLDSSSTRAKEATNVSDLILREQYQLSTIKDYDGNWHGYLRTSAPKAVKSTYKYQGKLDVNNDGTTEAIFTNKESGRWATASIDPITGAFDYSNNGQGGTTRIVGIYEDPLVQAGLVEKNSDLDGSRTFINDLKLDNLILKTVGDYDGDGFQEVYWSKVDNTAYLRAVMHADGNIQYANYQNLSQMTDYLTGNGFADTVALIA